MEKRSTITIVYFFMYAHVNVQLLSHGQFFAIPWTVACQAPLSMRFPRQEYQSGFLLQRIFPTQWSNPHLLRLLHWDALAGGFFITVPPGDALLHYIYLESNPQVKSLCICKNWRTVNPLDWIWKHNVHGAERQWISKKEKEFSEYINVQNRINIQVKWNLHDSIRSCILICIIICTAIKIIKRCSDGSWVYINIYWNSNDSEDKGWKSFKEFMDIRGPLRLPQAF